MWRLLLPLLALTLACSLTSDDNADDNAPTEIAFSTLPGTVTVGGTTPPTNIPPIGSANRTPTATGGVLLPTPQQNCFPRNDWVLYTVQSGETLSTIAQRTNTTVQSLISGNCLANADQIAAGQSLRVPTAPIQPTSITANCPIRWFFSFTAGDEDPQAPCPGNLQSMEAVGQNFEGGRVLWYNTTAIGYPTDTLYVIYNDGSWVRYEDTWAEGQTESDPSIVPPAERVQPVRAIGKLWREQPGVRQKLGWAYAAENFFSGRFQEPNPTSGTYADIYIDHGWRNLVLRLRRTSGMSPTFFWEVVGRY